MKLLLKRYNYFILLVFIFMISEWIVNPIGDFPLNDDWCYGKAIYFSILGDYTIGGFGAMTLFTHMMWGMAFVKTFGFTFTVLRMSTLVSVLIGLFFLEKIIVQITQNKLLAFLACLVLLFNPLYFNLSNTFMTDVNFNTLLTVCCYCALSFYQSRRYVYLVLFFVLAALLVLLRQYGIIAPVCFMLGCFVLKEKKWIPVAASVFGTIAVYAVLKGYEAYLSKILPPLSPYKFSGGIHLSDPEFQDMFFKNVAERYLLIPLHILVYSCPLAVIFLGSLLRSVKKTTVFLTALITAAFVYWAFSGVTFPFMNIFMNMNLGPETFHESWLFHSHTHSDTFDVVMEIVKYLFSGLTLFTLSLFLITRLKKGVSLTKLQPGPCFLAGLMLSYLFMLLITESYFDRYHIPFITITLILISYLQKEYALNYKLMLFPVLCFFYVAVFGTKDYLQLNRLRWEAYDYLRETRHVNAEKVNGGFELNCLNDYKENWWYDYGNLSTFDYVIQFNNEKDFELMKAYPFQRYFPYTKDQVNIFERIKK